MSAQRVGVAVEDSLEINRTAKKYVKRLASSAVLSGPSSQHKAKRSALSFQQSVLRILEALLGDPASGEIE
jgi:hypothetical protein